MASVVSDEALVEALGAIDGNRQVLDNMEHMVLSLLRERGCTWEELGGVLGLSRQGAKARYASLAAKGSR